MMKTIVTVVILLSLFLSCEKSIPPDKATIEQEILAVMSAQVKGWNEYKVEGYMEGYIKSDSLRFASGSRVTYGWQNIYQRFKSGYPDPKAMGKLSFSDISITILSDEAAVVFGRYTLERETDMPTGLFTLLFRKTDEGWRIVHDHTSAEQ